MKVVLNNGQYKITIPKDLAEEKGWNAGTKIRFVEDKDGNIILKVIEKPVEKKVQKRRLEKR